MISQIIRVHKSCFFTFAGVYGDVHRVKIMFNKKENALVQMADATQAQLGINKCALRNILAQSAHSSFVLICHTFLIVMIS